MHDDVVKDAVGIVQKKTNDKQAIRIVQRLELKERVFEQTFKKTIVFFTEHVQ